MSTIARDITYASTARTGPGRALIRSMELLTGRPALLRRARGYDAALARGAGFWEEMARRYGIVPEIVRGTLEAVPATGPVVVVANHPYGILDGLALSLILSRLRPGGFRIVANDVFLRAPDLRDVVLPVSFEDTAQGRATNLAMRRDALAFLGAGGPGGAGGLVGIFPGGAVSTSARPFGPIRDPAWRGFSAKLIRRSGATVVPIHFAGANSRLFSLATHLHATLRAGLLVREFRARVDGPVQLSVGAPISPAEIAAHPGNQSDLMAWLRARCYATGGEDDAMGYCWDSAPARRRGGRA